MVKTDMLSKDIYNLELQLLKPEIRASSDKLAELLWDDMIEFCSSGSIYQYKKNEALEQNLNLNTLKWQIKDFKILCLSNNVLLAMYILDKNSGANIGANCSLRSSIWKCIDGKWKMVFHQGTQVPE